VGRWFGYSVGETVGMWGCFGDRSSLNFRLFEISGIFDRFPWWRALQSLDEVGLDTGGCPRLRVVVQLLSLEQPVQLGCGQRAMQ